MENEPSKLILFFIGNKKNTIFNGFKILQKTYDFETTEITIPNNIFSPRKEKKIIDFQLILKEDENEDGPIIFQFYIYIGINKVYCFINQISQASFDICCLDKKVRVDYGKTELTEFNYLENDARSRIVLINVPSTLKINTTKNLYSYIPLNLSESNSVQICFFHSDFQTYSVKAITNDEISEEFTIVNFLREKKGVLLDFYNKMTYLIETKQENVEIYKTLLAEIEISRIKDNFSRRKDILEKVFKDNELYDLFHIYILWFICEVKYFPKQDEECNIPIDIIYKYINEFYEKYKKDQDLLNYQRILLFYSNSIFFIRIGDVEKYKKTELEYIKVNKAQKNSVFGVSFKFLEDFIDNLNSKSELFYPLLLLDNGLFYHNEKPSYGFDFESCDKVKNHLRNLIPDVFFVYKIDSINEEKGFNYNEMKTVFLNKLTVLNNYKGNPKNEDSNTKIVKHYAMRISKLFMHECFRDNKFLYQQKIGIDSPRYFFNKNKRLITMIPKNNKNKVYSNEDYFFVEQGNYEGESGNFLEYFFGFYENELVSDLLYSISDIGKLIDNVKYFTCEKLDVLKNYIINKYIISIKKIDFHEKENTSLEQDIIEMDQLLEKENACQFEKIQTSKERKLNKQIKDQSSKLLLYEGNEKEIKNYSYYLKKMIESKNNDESRKYTRELIFNHLKKI